MLFIVMRFAEGLVSALESGDQARGWCVEMAPLTLMLEAACLYDRASIR